MAQISQLRSTIGSNCPGMSGTVPGLWTLSRVLEGFTICPGCGPDSKKLYDNIQFMLYLHCSDAAMGLQLVQNGSLSSKKATVLCLNHESLHTSTLITNLWAWFVGVASNMTRVCGRGRWVWPWSRKGLRKSWSLCSTFQ